MGPMGMRGPIAEAALLGEVWPSNARSQGEAITKPFSFVRKEKMN